MNYGQNLTSILVPRGNRAAKIGELFPSSNFDLEPGQLTITRKAPDGSKKTTFGLDPTTVAKGTGAIRLQVATPQIRSPYINPMTGVMHFDQSGYIPVAPTTKVLYGEAKPGSGSVAAYALNSAPVAGTNYRVIVTLESDRNLREYSSAGNTKSFNFKAPEDVASMADGKAHVIGTLVQKMNMLSAEVNRDGGNMECITFAIDRAGNPGTAAGSKLVSAIKVGDVIVAQEGRPGFRFDEFAMRTLRRLVSESTDFAAATVVTLPASVATTGTGTVGAGIDGMITLSRDQYAPVHDRFFGGRLTAQVSFGDGFMGAGANGVRFFRGAESDISRGTLWQREFEQSGAYNRTGLDQVEGYTDSVLRKDSYIDLGTYYDCYTFSYTAAERTLVFTQIVEQFVKVLVPVTFATGADGAVTKTNGETGVRAAMTALKGVFDAL